LATAARWYGATSGNATGKEIWPKNHGNATYAFKLSDLANRQATSQDMNVCWTIISRLVYLSESDSFSWPLPD